jgi:CMP-N-acetylneuraminic acid synthetase
MKSLAIIPARGGSTRLKSKNKKKIGNFTLVERAINAALKSNKFTNILVSTDDVDILKIVKNYQKKSHIINIHRRNKKLSSNTATALELVNYLVEKKYKDYDFVSLLLPTCPFRSSVHIKEAFKCLDKYTDSVVSLTQYEFPVALSVKIKSKFINLSKKSPLLTGNTRSQDQEIIYRPNGAIYLSKIKSFLKYQNFWKGKVRPYAMSRLNSIDIDDKMDLDYANFILRNKYV